MTISAMPLRHSSISGTQWQVEVKEGQDIIGSEVIAFTDSTYTYHTIYTANGIIRTDNSIPYYLADTPPSSFDAALVGKETQGSYIVLNKPGSSIPYCLSANITTDGKLRIIEENCITNEYSPTDPATIDSLLAKAQAVSNANMNRMIGQIRRDGTSADSTLYLLMDEAGELGAAIHYMPDERLKGITTLRIGGPINSYDVLSLRRLVCGDSPRCPDVHTLDLSRAWTVTDTIFYDTKPYYTNHKQFGTIRGPRNDAGFIGTYLEDTWKDCVKTAVHTRYGFIVELVPDSAYIKFLTTYKDCISEWMLEGMPHVVNLRLPEHTLFIYHRALANCPSLREVTIPRYVRSIASGVFANDTSLIKVRVADNSYLPNSKQFDRSNTEQTAFPGCRPDLIVERYQPMFAGGATDDKGKQEWMEKFKEWMKTGNELRRDIEKMRMSIYKETNTDSIRNKSMRYKQMKYTLDMLVSTGAMQNQDTPLGSTLLFQYCKDINPRLLQGLLLLLNDSTVFHPKVKVAWDYIQRMTSPLDLDLEQYDDTTQMKKIIVSKAGTLRSAIEDNEWPQTTRISVSGPLDDTDIKWLNEVSLAAIDLADAVITELPEKAFMDNRHLQYVRLPKTLLSIGRYAFSNCSNLARIDMNEGLRTIGYNAFRQDTRLREITLPESVDTIASYVFGGCDQLRELRIPANTRHIGIDITRNCPRANLTIDPANKHYIIKEGMIKGLTSRTREMQGQSRIHK